nr:MAG TPA: hypothetical protein [Caudoviricetes sp.]
MARTNSILYALCNRVMITANLPKPFYSSGVSFYYRIFTVCTQPFARTISTLGVTNYIPSPLLYIIFDI